jgi:hypothetical protein
LALSSSNIGQAFFLIFNWVVILFFITVKNKSLLKVIEKAYFSSGLIVCFFAFYQLISILTGIYYPKDIILNTKNFSIFGSDAFGFLPRISSTFVEPSYFAMFMVGFLAWTYINLLKNENPTKIFYRLFIFFIALFSLVVSTSTTGFAARAIFFILHAFVNLFSRNNRIVKIKIMIILLILSLTIFLLYFFVPGIDTILNAIIFDKGTTNSSLHRLAADQFSFTVLHESNYFGAGLGSNRPSSFLTFLISNTGILGFLLIFISMVVLLIYAMRANSQKRASQEDVLSCEASGWALLVMIIAKVLAGPDLNFPPMWILLGYFILSIRQIQYKNN